MNAGESPIVFLFSGHGTQYYRMGLSLLSVSSVFKDTFSLGSKIVNKKLGFSLEEVLASEDMKTPFSNAMQAHIALFLTQYSLAKALIAEGIQPSVVIGSSLGEVVALTIAGVLDFEDVLDCICEEALLWKKNSNGLMAAALMTPEKFKEFSLAEVDMAGVNTPNNIVLSGVSESVENALLQIEKAGIATQRLPVKVGFHSRSIDSLKNHILDLWKNVEFADPKVTIWPTSSDSQEKFDADFIWNVYRKPILLSKSQSRFEKLEGEPATYIDCSPSGTMVTSLKYNLPKPLIGKSFMIMHMFMDIEKNFKRVLSEARS